MNNLIETLNSLLAAWGKPDIPLPDFSGITWLPTAGIIFSVILGFIYCFLGYKAMRFVTTLVGSLSAEEKMSRGVIALDALTQYRLARAAGRTEKAVIMREKLEDNMPYFGYGHILDKQDLVPPVPLVFWAFRVMVGLGSLFCLVFLLLVIAQYKKQLTRWPLLLRVAVWCIPLVYICSQAGWVCAEVGRQPWAIQDLLPVNAAVSALQSPAVRITFFIFLVIFTLLLIAELRILFKVVKKGPQIEEGNN